jgi:hypothetical protein
MSRAFLASALLSFCATPAIAADNGIYLGGSIGQTNVDVGDGLPGFDLDNDATGYKIIAGIRPLDFLAFEASYVDFGQVEDSVAGTDFAADAKGIDAFAVGLVSLPFADLFAKAGLMAWDARLTADGVSALDDDGQDFAWGAGAQVRFGSVAVRAEYERFKFDDLDDVNMISLGFTWTFL